MDLKKIYILFSCFLMIVFMTSCEDNEGGNCSISCGGAGTGQPFVQTNHPFVTENRCKELGEDKAGGCKASFCPPTGNSSDCFQVYP